MDKLTPDIIWYIILFLAPGFLASFWIQRYVPKPQGDSDGKSLLTYISLSVILYIPLIVSLVIRNRLPYVHNRADFYWIAATILLFPIPLSMLFGWGIQNDWVGKIFRRIGLRPKRFTATAWEEFFSHNPVVAVIVTLDDGKQVAGVFYGDQATASSDPAERDLYLPVTCTVVDGHWTITKNTAGILIRAQKITHLEFFNLSAMNTAPELGPVALNSD
jgi:hypothetical protein